MEDASDHLHAFQEYEHYTFGGNSWADYDILEDELFNEMEDISSSDKEQLVPVKLQGAHGQQGLNLHLYLYFNKSICRILHSTCSSFYSQNF